MSDLTARLSDDQEIGMTFGFGQLLLAFGGMGLGEARLQGSIHAAIMGIIKHNFQMPHVLHSKEVRAQTEDLLVQYVKLAWSEGFLDAFLCGQLMDWQADHFRDSENAEVVKDLCRRWKENHSRRAKWLPVVSAHPKQQQSRPVSGAAVYGTTSESGDADGHTNGHDTTSNALSPDSKEEGDSASAT